MASKPTSLTFDGETFARAWNAVAVAYSKDSARTILAHTVLVEWFADGVRLVATDSYIVATAWVPATGQPETAPDIGESPPAVTIASDVDGRGASLFKHVVSITKGDEAPTVDLELSVREVDLDADQLPLSSDLASRALCVDLPGTERVMLRAVEGEYPNWRSIVGGLPEPIPTEAVTLAVDMRTRLAKIGKEMAAAWVRSSMRGESGAVSFTTAPGDHGVFVSGAYMPVRTT